MLPIIFRSSEKKIEIKNKNILLLKSLSILTRVVFHTLCSLKLLSLGLRFCPHWGGKRPGSYSPLPYFYVACLGAFVTRASWKPSLLPPWQQEQMQHTKLPGRNLLPRWLLCTRRAGADTQGCGVFGSLARFVKPSWRVGKGYEAALCGHVWHDGGQWWSVQLISHDFHVGNLALTHAPTYSLNPWSCCDSLMFLLF